MFGITHRDYTRLIDVLRKPPAAVEEIVLVGSVAKKGASEKDLDILVVLNSGRDNAYEEFRSWMHEIGEFDHVHSSDDGVVYIDEATGEVHELDTWKWGDITLDTFYMQSEDLPDRRSRKPGYGVHVRRYIQKRSY